MRRVEVTLLALALVGCRRQERLAVNPSADVGGWYRAVFIHEGVGEVPFFLSLPANPTKGGAVVLNGKHWFSAVHTWKGERVEVDFPVYNTKILAAVAADRQLIGSWESESRAWGAGSLQFRGIHIEEPNPELKLRTADSPPPSVDPSGVWRVTFDDSPGKLVIQKEGVTAYGATVYLDADTVYVSGNVVGKQVLLSGFDGTAAYYMVIDVDGDSLEGKFHTGILTTTMVVRGTRAKEDFELPEEVELTSPDKRIRLPELDHPRYAGHPVIVELSGSWCPHCGDLAPVLSKIYESYQGQDLQILTVDYEFTSDKTYNLERAAQLKKEYRINWQMVTRDGEIEDYWKILPSGMTSKEIAAFPITIFLNRDGTVHRLHSGFIGPESGAAHYRLVDQFETWTKEIVK